MLKSKKLWIKLLLDVVMLVVLLLLFRKNNFGIQFHEIAGLLIFFVFLLHIFLNWRWVCQVTKHFFKKNMSMRTRIGWILNLGLLVCFVIIILSGIFMSRVLFHFSIDGNWRLPHYFCSALALIFVGIHLGLHFSMIGNAIQNRLHLRPLFCKVLAGCFAIIVIATGLYSIPNTSFQNWMMMPFQTSTSMRNEKNSDLREERPEKNEEKQENQSVSSPNVVSFRQEKEKNSSENTKGKMHGGRNGKSRENNTIGTILWKTTQYASICLMIAFVTWGIEFIIFKKRKKKKHS